MAESICNESNWATLRSNETEGRTEARHVLETIQMYYTPFLVAFGSLGNWISVVVFFSTKLRKLSSSFYLAALAVSDTGFLLTIFVVWLNMVDVPFFNQHIVCELCTYLSSVCSFLSVWFVVAFTVERFIAVGYPLKRPSMCTVSRAKIVLAGLTAASFLVYMPHVFIAGLQSQFDERLNCTVIICGMKKEYADLANILNNIDFFVTLILPFFAISVINTSICLTVWRLARVRRTMTLNAAARSNGADSGVRAVRPVGHVLKSQSSQTKVTKMLLVVSTVFICLNLPSYVIRVWAHFHQSMDSQPDQHIITLQHAFLILFNTNFGINFVLYCVSGQNFRKALVSLCCPRRGRTNETTTRVTVVSEFGRSLSTRRRTITLNGSLREAHEMLPLAK